MFLRDSLYVAGKCDFSCTVNLSVVVRREDLKWEGGSIFSKWLINYDTLKTGAILLPVHKQKCYQRKKCCEVAGKSTEKF